MYQQWQTIAKTTPNKTHRVCPFVMLNDFYLCSNCQTKRLLAWHTHTRKQHTNHINYWLLGCYAWWLFRMSFSVLVPSAAARLFWTISSVQSIYLHCIQLIFRFYIIHEIEIFYSNQQEKKLNQITRDKMSKPVRINGWFLNDIDWKWNQTKKNVFHTQRWIQDK